LYVIYVRVGVPKIIELKKPFEFDSL
jgi:hypothetical protein